MDYTKKRYFKAEEYPEIQVSEPMPKRALHNIYNLVRLLNANGEHYDYSEPILMSIYETNEKGEDLNKKRYKSMVSIEERTIDDKLLKAVKVVQIK